MSQLRPVPVIVRPRGEAGTPTARESSRSAFTLIEVLVVVAILALLVAVLLPSLSRAREQSKTIVCRTRLRELYNGHAMYAVDYRNRFPHWDCWLWDGMTASGAKPIESVIGQNPNLYVRCGGSRPSDSSQWVTFGMVYRYVRQKEVYFCPNDRKRRVPGSAAIGSGGTKGDTPIHSYTRFIEPHNLMKWKLSRAKSSNADDETLNDADCINPDSLRPTTFAALLTTAYTTTPSRMGLLFEEYPGFDENIVGAERANDNMSHKRAALNDGVSGFEHPGFSGYHDYMVFRHMGQGQINFWDGHSAMVSGKLFNGDKTYAAWLAIGGPRRK